MRNLKYIFFLGTLLIAFGCSSNRKTDNEEQEIRQDVLTGKLSVVVDESILPLIEEQVEVFRSSYTQSRISLIGKPERVAINELLKGAAPVAILTRTLTDEESNSFKQRSITPRIFPIAHDGIVLVANKLNTDSLLTLNDIFSYLKGIQSNEKHLVFDNVNSSVFRYLKELSGVERVSSASVKTMENSRQVIPEISNNKHAIGVLSFNQFLASRDSLGNFDNIRILSIQNEDDKKFYKPSQSSLADHTYPLKQTIYVLNYQPSIGLGIGFSSFLTGDRGQRIVLKSGLVPAKMPGRDIIIRDNINY